MFDQLMRALRDLSPTPEARQALDLKTSVAALLVEAASMDETFSDDERQAIAKLLALRFALADAEVKALIADAEARVAETTQYHPFADRICKELEIPERTQIIEMMWSVAYADGELDPHEDMLLRQVAGLLHVPDRDRGLAKQRALAARHGQ